MKKYIRFLILFACISATGLWGCTNYGKKVSRDYLEVYYKNGVTREQAQRTVDFLYPYWKEPGTEKTKRKSVQLTKSGDTVNFRMVTDQKKLSLVSDEMLYDWTHVFSDSLFNGAPVNLDLTDNKFKTVKTLHFRPKLNEQKAEELVTTDEIKPDGNKDVTEGYESHMKGGIKFFWKSPVTNTEATTIGNAIIKTGAFTSADANNVNIFMEKEGDRYLVKFPIVAAYRNDASYLMNVESVGKQIKVAVFANSPFSFVLTDEQLNTVKSFDY